MLILLQTSSLIIYKCSNCYINPNFNKNSTALSCYQKEKDHPSSGVTQCFIHTNRFSCFNVLI